MERKDMQKLPNKWLKYEFTYQGQKHRGRILLDEESTPNLVMMYDDHDLEVTWIKRISNKGVKIELNITIADDWNEMKNLWKVVASAWVCVYKGKTMIASFEPDCWSYIDEEDVSNNTCKGSFYEENTAGRGCTLCNNPHRCRRK